MPACHSAYRVKQAPHASNPPGMMAAMFFEVAGIAVPLWLPLLAAFVVSFFGSMVGVSGGVLLLPFQMSVLG